MVLCCLYESLPCVIYKVKLSHRFVEKQFGTHRGLDRLCVPTSTGLWEHILCGGQGAVACCADRNWYSAQRDMVCGGAQIHGSVIAFVGGRGHLLLFLGLRLFLSRVRSSDEDVGFERLLFCSVA